MEWLAKVFEKYLEMGVYLAIGIGYLIGRLKYRGVGLGVVTGSLLGGIFLGNFFHVAVSDQAKAMLFLLFLFGIGYSVGPSFFRNLKRRWVAVGFAGRSRPPAGAYDSLRRRPFPETRRGIFCRLTLRITDGVAGNRNRQRSDKRIIPSRRSKTTINRTHRCSGCHLLHFRYRRRYLGLQ
jgi:hypothetical protein